jgi:putative ABC transport system ATP-binding protein
MKVIEIKDLHKIYSSSDIEVHAVNGVNLDFREAEFAAIVGPSGSGKTTLLNLLGGLDMPTSGQILIDGTDLSKLKSSALIDFRMKNIGFMSLQKWIRKDREERSYDLLKSIGLADRYNSRPAKLSGGQQQRVAVARALASRPKFVLADEPTANLDSKAASTLLEIMEKLNNEEKITFIFSTHDPRVMKMAHRVITLEDGKVVSDEVREETRENLE